MDLQREKIRLWPWTSAANHAGKSGVHPITSGSGSVVLIGQKDTQPLGVFKLAVLDIDAAAQEGYRLGVLDGRVAKAAAARNRDPFPRYRSVSFIPL